MKPHEIRFVPRDIPSWIRDTADNPDDASEIITVVRHYLAENQPFLLKHVALGTDGGGIVIEIAQTAPPGIHVGVEAALGLESRLHELACEHQEDLRELEVDMESFQIEVSDDLPADYQPDPLQSLVTYYPLPTCEWYEYCDGVLSINADRVLFKSEYAVLSDAPQSQTGGHWYDVSEIVAYGLDHWWNVQCLRVVTERARYRYGWAPGFEEMALEFDIDEWFRMLARLAPSAQRVPSFG